MRMVIKVGRQQTCASIVTSPTTDVASAITFDACCILSTVSTRMADISFTILDFICHNTRKNEINVRLVANGAQHRMF